MITANEARQNLNIVDKSDSRNQLAKIEKKVEMAIRQHRSYIDLDFDINHITVQKLRDMGYTVKYFRSYGLNYYIRIIF